MKASIEELLTYTLEADASDLHLSTDSIPMIRVHGEMKKLDLPPITLESMIEIKENILPIKSPNLL